MLLTLFTHSSDPSGRGIRPDELSANGKTHRLLANPCCGPCQQRTVFCRIVHISSAAGGLLRDLSSLAARKDFTLATGPQVSANTDPEPWRPEVSSESSLSREKGWEVRS